MPWNAPVTPIPGTVITVAYAVSNIVNPVNWLRQMTGGNDPGSANLALVSTGPTTTSWGLIQDAAMAVQKVSRQGDTMTGDLQINRTGAASPSTGYLILGNNGTYYLGFDGSRHVLSTPRLDVQGDTYVYRVSTPTQGYLILGNSAAHYVGFNGTDIVADGSTVWTDANSALRVTTGRLADGAVTTAKIGDAQVTSAKLAAGVAAVPSGLVALVRTAAEIPAGWTRETNLDGRMAVGAGTTFGTAFAEATNYGSAWSFTPLGTISISIGSHTASEQNANLEHGGSDQVEGNHDHAITGQSFTGSGTTWTIPSRAYVYVRKSP